MSSCNTVQTLKPHKDAQLIDTPILKIEDDHFGCVAVGLRVDVKKSDNAYRQRSYFHVDGLRFADPNPENIYKSMMQRLTVSDKASWRDSNNFKPSSGSETIDSMIEGRGSVLCPWPTDNRKYSQHHPYTNHKMDLTFALHNGEQFTDLENMTEDVYINGKSTKMIKFKVDPAMMRKLLDTDVCSQQRWDSKSSYHIMPVEIYTSCIDSNLPGLWHVSLMTQLPQYRSRHPTVKQHTEQHNYPVSALIGPSVALNRSKERQYDSSVGDASKSFEQYLPIRECPIGGVRSHEQIYQIRSATYSSPQFSRWVYADYCKLTTELDLIRDSKESKDITASNDQAIQPMMPLGYKYIQCSIPMPANWQTLYQEDLFSVRFIVLAELKEIRKIYEKMVKADAVQNNSEATPAQLREFPILDATPQGRVRCIIIPFEAIRQHLVSRKESYDAEQYMMRLDELALYLAPVNGEAGWKQLKQVCEERNATLGSHASSMENRVRFSLDMTILYEASQLPVKTDDANGGGMRNNGGLGGYPESQIRPQFTNGSSSNNAFLST